MNRTKVLGLAFSAVVAAMAHGQTFNWQLNGDIGIQASGQFIVTGNQVTSFTGQIGSSGIGPYPITGLAAPGSGGLGSGGDNAWPLTESGIVSTIVRAGNSIVLSIANPPNTTTLTPPSNVVFTITGIGLVPGGEFKIGRAHV